MEAINKEKDCTFIINGDHGMSDVTFMCDVKTHINEICKKSNIDTSNIDLFIDSTLLRVYTNEIEAMDIIMNDKVLNKLGSFVYQDEGPEFKKYYGDLIWCIKSGGLILPNYFQNSLINGMHGYIPNTIEHYGTLIIKNPKYKHDIQNSIKLIQVNKIIRNEIEKRY